MLELLAFSIPIGFGVGVFYLVFRISKQQIEKIQRQFSYLADAYNLEYQEAEGKKGIFKKFPALQGKIDGKTFYLFMFNKGSGKNQRTYTSFRMQTRNPMGHTLRLSREGLLSKVGKKFGMQDIQIGDEHFDPLYIIKGSDEYFVRSVLDHNVKEQMILSNTIFKGNLKVEGDMIEYTEQMTLNKPEKREIIEQHISIVKGLSESISRFSGKQSDPD